MNRIIIFAFFLLVFYLISCRDGEKAMSKSPNVIAFFSAKEMIIDGYLTEPAWQKTQTVTLCENRTGDPVIDSTYLTQVKTVYSSSFLYIAFVCKDPDIWGNFTDRDQHLWTEEAVEVFIDTDQELNTYVEIEVSPKNILFDSYIVDPVNIDILATKKFDLVDIKTAVAVDGSINNESDKDNNWSVEIAIPIKELVNDNSVIMPGRTEWRINFYRIERKRNGESKGYAWSPTRARFHRPEVFGLLRFGDQKIKE